MRATASAIACEGSEGVEKTLRIRSVLPSSQTQSVNVPPLSIAIRNGLDAAVERMLMSGAASCGLFSAVFADSVDLEGMAGGIEAVFLADLLFQLADFRKEEFH